MPASFSAPAWRCSRPCPSLRSSWSTKSTTAPSSNRKACDIRHAMRRSSERSSPPARWCWAARRRRSRAGTTSARAATSELRSTSAPRPVPGCPWCARSICATSRLSRAFARRCSRRSARAWRGTSRAWCSSIGAAMRRSSRAKPAAGLQAARAAPDGSCCMRPISGSTAITAARAGRRDQQGEVLVQTRYPDHPLFAALATHDFAGFAESQLAERRSAGFPPYVFEAVLRAEAPQLASAMAFLREARAQQPAPDSVGVFDPVPHTLTRRAGFERAQLVMQSGSRSALQAYLAALGAQLYETAPRGVRWHLDVDPIEFD